MGIRLARLYSAELEGIDAKTIEVEADVSVGLHAFNIVGLADRALNEARERVNAAIKNSGIKPPDRENRKITINLAPAAVRKTGSNYDLAIALGYLAATNQIVIPDFANKLFAGELALDGTLRPISGALNIAEHCVRNGFEFLFLPKANANEAAAISDIKVIGVKDLKELFAIFAGQTPLVATEFKNTERSFSPFPNFGEVHGQQNAKRALMIAAAGQHNILLSGPPGVGKSLLSQALAGILPPTSEAEAIEITKIWSAAGFAARGLFTERPFRAPHHTASLKSLVGGGSDPKPGEISLAHRGVLFLDELPEFEERTLEALREPLETGMIHIARAKRTVIFPARFSLVAAMNPCPCGNFGQTQKPCICRPSEVIRYGKKLSGPLLDRIDLHVKVGSISSSELHAETMPDESLVMKSRVEQARAAQRKRFAALPLYANAEMDAHQTKTFLRPDSEALLFLKTLADKQLSPRGYYRLLKVARTIADLEQKENASAEHLAEAFSYRLKGFD